MVEETKRELEKREGETPVPCRKGLLRAVFRQAGVLAAHTRIASGKTARNMAKGLAVLDVKKDYMAGPLLRPDVLFLEGMVKMRPESADAQYNLGSALMNKRRFSQAALCFERAVLLNFHHIGAYIGAAQANRELGRHDEAIKVLNNAVPYEGDAPEIYYELGVTCDEKGMHDEAIGYLKNALELRPGFEAAQKALDSMQEIEYRAGLSGGSSDGSRSGNKRNKTSG